MRNNSQFWRKKAINTLRWWSKKISDYCRTCKSLLPQMWNYRSWKKGVSFKHEGELGEFEKVVQTLDTFMKYFSPIKCHKLIYLLIYVDFLNTCSGRWHFQLASHIADRTTHRPIKIHLIKNLKAKIRQPIGCDIAFRQIENMAQSLTYVFVKILL